jgi:phenylacetate-CoA ligase
MYKQLAKYTYSLTTALRGEKVRRYFNESLTTQKLSGDALNDYQLRRLKKQLEWACERVPFYRGLYQREGLSPESINSLDDLVKFPIISKSRLQKEPGSFKAEAFRGTVRTETTGGSLGEPLIILKDAENLARKRAAVWRFYDWYGIEYGDRQARFWGVPFGRKLKRREKLKDLLGNRIRLNAFEITDLALTRFYKKLRSTHIDYIYGYASTIFEFAEFVRRRKLENPSPDLKASILTAETVYDSQRETVGKVFRAPTVVEYGCGEVGIVAFECPERNLHINADNVILEIIDGSTVVTELHAKATPLIRYRLGDSATISENGCSCGCGFPILEYVAGRESDMLKIGGKKLHCQALNYVFLGFQTYKKLIRRFQVVQRASDDSLTVYIIPGDNYPDDGLKVVEKIIRDRLDFHGVLKVIKVDDIPLDPSGKLRYFIRK